MYIYVYIYISPIHIIGEENIYNTKIRLIFFSFHQSSVSIHKLMIDTRLMRASMCIAVTYEIIELLANEYYPKTCADLSR